MKKNILIAGIVFLSVGSCLTGCGGNKTAFETIEASRATEMTASKNITVIDVRTPDEFSEGHLPNAKNFDFLNSSFKDQIGKLDKKKRYLVYCRSGQRSTQAAEIMKEHGFDNVTNMLGGLSQWQGQLIK